jgi:hypothetical protein
MDNKIALYEIVFDRQPDRLADKINNLILDGWQLNNGLVIAHDERILYLQVMVKYEK